MAIDYILHRPGPLKQTNKAHKTGRHRSKGAIDNALKGRISVKSASHVQKQQQRREQRRNQANQIRKNKRNEAISKKRQLGSITASPFLVCILPMHKQIDAESVLAILQSCDSEAVVDKSPTVTYVTVSRFKQRFAFIIPPIGFGTELTVLDYLKVCDTTLLVTSTTTGEDNIFDEWGLNIYNMISAQGIPSPIVTLMDLESVNPKRRIQTKAAVQKYISKLLPDQKVVQIDTSADGLNLMRRIGGQKHNVLHNQANRAHLYGEKVEFESNPTGESGVLKVTGFLRGRPLDVNGIVHIPGLGDFQINQIDAPSDPYESEKYKHNSPNKSSVVKIIAKANISKQASLQRENVPDDMDAEQTWPAEEEFAGSKDDAKKKKFIKRVPKGMSDYQACWIPNVEEADEDDSESGSESEANSEEEFMSCESEIDSDGGIKNGSCDANEECDTITVSEGPIHDEKYDLAMDLQEERETLQKINEARADQMWPDEVDTPIDIAAKDRFQKYRGLESFRTSPWDPKENLPCDYSRIYKFKNFDRTKRRIIKESADIDGGMPGWYLTIHVNNVNLEKWNIYKSARRTETCMIYGLLPHEHQMSVVNVVLKRIPDSEVPIKSKEKLIVQCGYRRFIVNPIFSQHTNGDKHKFERYFRPHTTVVATFYAPIQFPPAPILCFKENPNSTLALVARGSLLSCNPDRIIVKRIVFSGHPMRIHRKSAVVRYMFFNKEDVHYFKPVKLHTKCGRVGHIKESLGTHGHMKCMFDGQLKSYDTVFMYLYKRVFPKWTYEDYIVACECDNMLE